MKKRYFFIALAIIALTVSGILVISKNSYADAVYSSCYDHFNVIYSSSEVSSFIKDNNNGIRFPSFIELQREDRATSRNSGYTYSTSAPYLYLGNPGGYSVYKINRDSISYDFGYLLKNMKFSLNQSEDRYYKQILIFWFMDIISGYSDDYNYIMDYDSWESYTVPKEDSFIDKFENGFWKYQNNLSAGDKEMIKSSSMGDTLQQALQDLIEFSEWHNLDSQEELTIDSIDVDDITFILDGDYLETSLIFPNSDSQPYSYAFSGYSIKVSDSLVVLNRDGEEQKSFSNGEGFKIRIPVSSIKNNIVKFSVDITGTFDLYQMDLYDPMIEGRYNDSEISAMTYNPYGRLFNKFIPEDCYLKEKINSNLTFNVEQKVGNLNIKVIDSSTGNNLSKAEVTVYDLKGNEVYKYETTDQELNITLPVGEYIVKQTVTPPNYEAQTIQMRVDVTEEGSASAVLENAPLVNVPDTALGTPIYIIIGGLLAIAGGMIVGITFRKRRSF